jgi:hypothetical protein
MINHPFWGIPIYEPPLKVPSTDATLSWSQVVFTGDFNCASSDPPLQERLGSKYIYHISYIYGMLIEYSY